ncbi:hypothetical protein CONPUDRAFT_180563 [Coniophora puteana RWD-64-598 SS2]|uniref:Beta-xylanase n=1 Tax=Coniophora puteana (strain RWD-64-598) TaxID=741705 RepID=A0A5M3MEN9_CONPW|nr:uncharacterized protein CONPUDRAFT_180563 [Coniophora puteana RWD-64-598 SS2]EIW77476.1 hypothetical protein CONPUDRAFT_180563 [Coniophora puteana RWD-64-598 SS2]
MMKLMTSIAALLPFVSIATAQAAAYGQCGGTGWTGATTCVAGYTCTYSSAYYSQCLPSTGSTSGGSGTSTASGALPTGTSTGVLNTLAQSIGKKYFGSATDNPEFTDTAYMAILESSEFGQITPGNSMKWDATEPEQNTFTFTQGDAVVSIAKESNKIVRGHNLVWQSQLPSWVSSGGFTAAELTSVIQNHISNVVGEKSVNAWDVVNEPFNSDGSYVSDVFYNTLGSDFIPIALTAARAADPNALLCINDYGIEGSGTKSTAMQNLVKTLKADGVPIDCIGFESHFILGEVPTDLQSNIEAFTALGVVVMITELDIRMTLPETAAQLEQQKTDYQTVVSACAAVDDCVGITVWDFTDKYSWVPSTFSGQGAACPYDDNLIKKPAFDGIVAGLS